MIILLFSYIRDPFNFNQGFLLSGCSWPVRTLSFSHDGEMLASGSEDLIIDIVRTYWYCVLISVLSCCFD